MNLIEPLDQWPISEKSRFSRTSVGFFPIDKLQGKKNFNEQGSFRLEEIFKRHIKNKTMLSCVRMHTRKTKV